MQLFDFENILITLLKADGEITYWESFIEEDEAKHLFDELKDHSEWKEETISVFGKRYKFNLLVW